MASFWPVTVTVCAAFQLPVVNERLGGATVAAALLLVSVTVTLPVGWLVSLTVYCAMPPASATVTPVPDAETLTPRVSLSLTFTVAVAGLPTS